MRVFCPWEWDKNLEDNEVKIFGASADRHKPYLARASYFTKDAKIRHIYCTMLSDSFFYSNFVEY